MRKPLPREQFGGFHGRHEMFRTGPDGNRMGVAAGQDETPWKTITKQRVREKTVKCAIV